MNYKQLTDAQRYKIEVLLKENYSITDISKIIKINRSTIYRELKRNSKKRSYNALFAQKISDERRKEASKHIVLPVVHYNLR